MTAQPFTAPRRIVICFRHSVTGAADVAARLAALAQTRGVACALASVPDPGTEESAAFAAQLAESDLLICVGGDGTVLHAAEYAALSGTPIFGVRMGRLGFLTESTEAAAETELATVLDGRARVEERALARAVTDEGDELHALNDVVIGRHTIGRTVSVGVRLDGVLVAEYRGDAVIVATATGSTGYSLSVGGPILHPTSQELVLVPVAPHLTRASGSTSRAASRP